MTAQKKKRDQCIEPFKHFELFHGKEFDAALKLLHDYADEYGLSEEDLEIVTNICFTPKIAMFRFKKLIESLIPVTNVAEASIRKAIKWLLCNKKAPLLSTKLVLQWLSGLVEYNLDKTQIINKYYNLFYYYLDTNYVNVYASKIIYLLTKPGDVRRWYVKQVLVIHERQNKPKHTSALLYLFKMYRPDCVPENIQAYAVDTIFGSLPERLIRGFSRARDNIAHNNSTPQNTDNIIWIQLDVRKSKKHAIQLIPSVARNEFNLNAYKDGSKSLLSISNVSDLYKYHLSMSSPGRVMALLNNSAGYHLLTFCDTNAHSRFSYQLYYTLHDAFIEANPLVSLHEKTNLLKQLSFFQIHMQQSIPVVSKFLAEYIIRWDGHEYEAHIYRLMRWLHIVSFRELRDCILNCLFTIFISDTVETKCKILGFLGDVVCNMIINNRISNERARLFLNIELEWTLHDIKHLYKYIHSMCNIGIYIHKGHSLFMDSIIHLHYKIIKAETMSHIKLFRISRHLMYHALYSNNPTLLVRVCDLINRYPEYIVKGMKQDFLDVLWYNKHLPFKSDNTNIKAFDGLVEQYNLAKVFEWRQHFALACYNARILEKEGYIDLESFLKYAHSQYPYLCTFLGKHV